MKIAVIHEWLTTYAGSEKVLEAILSEFPDADLYCLIDRLPDKHRKHFFGKTIRTTSLQRVPFAKHIYRYLLYFMPFAVEQFDLSEYDIIISNCHSVAKGVLTSSCQLHICYCYTPMRYAWDLQEQYLAESGIQRGIRSLVARWMLHRIRAWDYRTAQNVDHFMACSGYIARRIRKTYRRDSTVIYPNVAVESFTIGDTRENFYLTSSRMVPYKKMHLIVEAFSNMPDRQLVVIGTGPQFQRCKALAGPNVRILGYQSDAVLISHLQRARAFIFAAEEDFGIAPVEAQACGTPVIAFGRGGAAETVIDGVTGLLFHEQSAAAIRQAVLDFEEIEDGFDRETLRANAIRFSTQRFRAEFAQFVNAKWAEHMESMNGPTHCNTPAAPVEVNQRRVTRVYEGAEI